MDAPIDAMRTLAAAIRSRSMAATAKLLRVDKATVSRRLAALERERPGLFERRAGRIEPTPAGERALAALAEVERGLGALDAALASDRDARGTVRLTVPASLAGPLVVPELPRFRAAHPEIDVVLLATTRVLDIARGDADIALRQVPPRGGAVVARRVAYIATGLWASREYLARRGAPAGHVLDGHDFLDFDFGTHAGPGFEWLPLAVRRTRVVLRSDDTLIIARAAAAGLGLAALPGFIAREHPDLVRIGDAGATVPLYLVLRADVRRLARVRAVTSWISGIVARHASRIGRV